jgi:CDP-glycerol glycerophosphotransferase (TagB/SpsB family)
MKTILLPIFNGLRARNFFLTDLYPELLRQNVKLVILAPTYKCEYYKETYKHPQVEFVEWDPMPEHWLGRVLQSFAFNALGTGTVREKQYAFYVRDHNLPKYILRRFIGIVFGKKKWVRKLIRLADKTFVPADPSLVQVIKKYAPDLVLAPDIILSSDRMILRAAKKLGIKTIGMVRSWDNLTAKGVIQVMPDYLIAQTHVMKKEAETFGDMPGDRVLVCGVPQFDMYWQPIKHKREEFLHSLNIPLDKRLVLCAPFFGEYSQKSGIMLIEELAAAIKDGRLPSTTHLLVRYRPEDGTAQDAPERFNDENITVTKPFSRVFRNKRGNPDYEFTPPDMDLMMDSLRYSDVTLNTISTLTVDAVALDKPVVNVRFDIDPTTAPGSRVELYSNFDHYKSLENTGGVRLAHSVDELIEEINTYLKNPELDSEGRAEIRREQIEFEDGKSGLRSAKAIVELLNS